ncbi:hypothetical protein like AT3G18670 [Hibiscus trionum]|uniref:PGG domain-containing protein n=1 Tax=Hibiscus trionum TaxID=183268 RepID=A0A9W7MV07_HIBTR|nr:hypothetical protein like AT3G18670 [Hibiscus trionum]
MEEKLIISESESNNFNVMKEVYAKLSANDAPGLSKIYQKNPEALFDRVTVCRDTVFHVASYKGSEEMLEMLVKLVPSTRKRELLRMKNMYGNTILHEVVTTANIKAADLLIRELLFSDGPSNHENDVRERDAILADRNKLGETPLFRAAEYGNKMMVMYMAREIERVGNLHEHYTRDDGVSILHIAVIGQHFDTAIWFVERDPQLATYKDKDGKTSLHLLASMATAFRSSSSALGIFESFVYNRVPEKPCSDDESDKLPIILQNKDLELNEPSKARHQSGHSKGWEMINRVWNQKKMHSSAVTLAKLLVRTDLSWFRSHEPEEDGMICLERKEGGEEEAKKSTTIDKCNNDPDTPMFIAASAGIVEIVEEILKEYPQAVEHINKMGQNILHVVTLHRTTEVYDLIINGCDDEKNRLARGIDNDGCTILHHAAVTEHYQGGTRRTPALELQQELKWLEDVRAHVPLHFKLHRNKDNKTADALFNDMHSEQLKTAQDWVKNTSQSCSTVAVLVATVVFAAAYASPGGFKSDGKPVLLSEPLYSFFTVMDVAGLASSLTSVVLFLSILTSSLEFEDFHYRIPRNLSLGFTFLFFSVTTTMLTFTATIFLLAEFKTTWTQNLTYAAALLPISIFALFQFPLYYEISIVAAKRTVDFLRKNMPGNW